MNRWLVIFRSHHEGPADVHFVDAEGRSMLAAIMGAKRAHPPLHPWVKVTAVLRDAIALLIEREGAPKTDKRGAHAAARE